MTDEQLLRATGAELADALARGRRVEPASLAGSVFHGTSLGLPAWIERLTWKTFAKVFVREPDGVVRGWNVRLEQGTPPTWQPRRRHGAPVTFGHFEVVDDGDRLVLDYGRGGNRAGDPIAALRDPLVALDDGGDRLLGRSLVALAGRTLPTPSYFVLVRAGSVEHVARPPRARTAHVTGV